MNNNKGSSLIGGFLVLCFTALIMFVLVGVLSITERPGGISRLVFSGINCLILIILSVTGGVILNRASKATLIQLWSATMLYSIFQFGAVFIGINIFHGRWYVLYHLIILFLYLCIVLPVINISCRKNINQKKEF